MKKILLILLISILLVSCSTDKPKDELEKSISSDVSFSTEEPLPEIKKSKLDELCEETGLEAMNYLVWEMDNNYTITYQRNFVGKQFLLETGNFNIAEYNDKIVLHGDGFLELYYITLTESQLEQLLAVEPTDSVIISFEIEDVQPVSTHWSSETEISGFDVEIYDNDASSTYVDWDIISENVSSYIGGSGKYTTIYGKCLEVLSIEKLSYD